MAHSYCDNQYPLWNNFTGNRNLDSKKETFVGSWKFNLSPKTPDSFTYAYTVIGPEGEVFTAKAELSRVK